MISLSPLEITVYYENMLSIGVRPLRSDKSRVTFTTKMLLQNNLTGKEWELFSEVDSRSTYFFADFLLHFS